MSKYPSLCTRTRRVTPASRSRRGSTETERHSNTCRISGNDHRRLCASSVCSCTATRSTTSATRGSTGSGCSCTSA
ncbi:hypothetical protein L915_09031 [Phytophthora nicotianae]|uniref:Uncharacterized protein n=1 Tax=Phytophthora nicotianae TaxID=4792 RepID=W2GVG6_PHYNI|nr:hypothetical protein L915_09031 [Phytophthora nicotianae]